MLLDSNKCHSNHIADVETNGHRAPLDRSRINALGVGVHAINMAAAVKLVERALFNGDRGYICATGVHGVMEAQKDPRFKKILSNALLVVPDGMPIVWIGKFQGFDAVGRVYGPDLMFEICRMSVEKGYSHFIYGGKAGVADDLARKMCEMFPGIKILGTFTPPFRPLTAQENMSLVELIRRLKPDIFWVGLGTPKQERFMAEHIEDLDTKVMFGVGAAFDIHTGRVKDAPSWVKKAGLQWLHRLCQEPRRLAKRYLINNPRFIYKMSIQILGLKKYSLNTPDRVTM